MKQIYSLDEVSQLVFLLHSEKKRIVLVGGCFDILHIGHISLLTGAKKAGDIVFVLLESDAAIRRKKGAKRPIHTQLQRAQVLSALKYVDYVLLLPDAMTDDEYDKLTSLIQPAIIATTENDPELSHKERQAKKTHAQVIFVNSLIQDVSTTSIAQALQNEL